MTPYYEREINEFMHHIEAWANGRIPETEENIARLADVLAEGFMIVRPDARIITREDLLNWFRRSHGREPDIEVTIKNIELRHQFGDVLLVMYEEWKQVGDALPTGALGSALLRKKEDAPNNLEWAHVHEAELPPPE